MFRGQFNLNLTPRKSRVHVTTLSQCKIQHALTSLSIDKNKDKLIRKCFYPRKLLKRISNSSDGGEEIKFGYKDYLMFIGIFFVFIRTRKADMAPSSLLLPIYFDLMFSDELARYITEKGGDNKAVENATKRVPRILNEKIQDICKRQKKSHPE